MYCVFHFLEMDEVEGSASEYDLDRINDFLEDMAAAVPLIHA